MIRMRRRNAGAPMSALMLGLMFVCASAAAQQASTATKPSHHSAAVQSPFTEAEALLRQGSVEESKKKIQEQLTLHPDSVAGYNLLGIAYSTEKNYEGAFEAFQRALKLSPNST